MIIFNVLGHLVIGVIVGVTLYSFGIVNTPIDMVLILYGSLLPDIDHPKSTLGRYNPLARMGWVKHRGFTHSIIGAFVFSAIPFYLIDVHMYYMVLIGCFGHILGDWAIGKSPKKQSMPLKIW